MRSQFLGDVSLNICHTDWNNIIFVKSNRYVQIFRHLARIMINVQNGHCPLDNWTRLNGLDSSNGTMILSFSISQVYSTLSTFNNQHVEWTLYIKRDGMLMFTKCLLNSLQKMEFLSESSKILNRFVWIFLIEFCKELKRKFVN